jgi:hypothetical protein
MRQHHPTVVNHASDGDQITDGDHRNQATSDGFLFTSCLSDAPN